jgi:tetratricopeptide (TPR) repeat protein
MHRKKSVALSCLILTLILPLASRADPSSVYIKALQVKALQQVDIGVRLRNHKQFRPAIEAFSQAIAASPKLASAYENRACCEIELENFQAALGDVNKAIELDPKMAVAYADRAKISNEKGNAKQAIADFSRAIALSKDKPNYTFYQDRGCLYQETGNDAGALEDFTSGLKADPQNCWLHYFRGCIYYKHGRYKEALADASEALKVQTAEEKGSFYQLRAKCYDKLGQPTLAKKDRETAQAAVGIIWGEK